MEKPLPLVCILIKRKMNYIDDHFQLEDLADTVDNLARVIEDKAQKKIGLGATSGDDDERALSLFTELKNELSKDRAEYTRRLKKVASQ